MTVLQGNSQFMHRFNLLIYFSFLNVFAFGQSNQQVNGIVLNNLNEALPGASIIIYHSGNITGLVANKEGRFVINSASQFDSIHISMVGYYSKTFSKEKINGLASVEIKLDPAPAELHEIVIRPITTIEIIKKTIANISSNQPQNNFENKGFYREIIKDKDNYFSVAEAVFEAQYFSSAKNYKLKLIQGRSKEDVAYTRLFEDFHPGGGPQAVAENGFITKVPEFLNIKDINKFHYKIDSIVQLDGRSLFHISFDQNAGVKEALDKGFMLIEMDDLAIVSYDIYNSPVGTPYIKSLTGSEKIFAEILNIDLKRKGWHTHVDFTNINNKWLMGYAETEYALSYKQPKKKLDLDLTINIQLAFTELNKTINKEITKDEEWKKKNIISNLPTAFDPAFWGNNNIISPTEQVKNIIDNITKNNKELPTGDSLTGWKYFNQDLFVSYQTNDTITLIPIMKCNWEDDKTGGFLFKEMDSDFVTEIKITIVKNSDNNDLPDRGFQQAGIMIRSENDPKENYV
ncbi:MAG TPA: carboxypeptidase-like regulatory domain-containing protein, partial [Puia sp.]|nr:carboxypeptidase-like regulatory domain-containing protein [Puia sp.]